MTSRDIAASQVTYVRSAHTSTVYYSTAQSALRVSTGDAITFLYFPLPADMLGKTVTSASIDLTAQSSAWSATNTLQRHAKPGTAYSRMTYSNRPGTLAGSSAVNGTQSGAVWSWNVLTDVAAVAAGGVYYGFRFITSDSTRRVFNGPDVTDGEPVLHLVYSDAPSAPAGVSPSGGVVSTNKPVVTWQPADDITDVQVQLDTTGSTWAVSTGFVSPTFDSGAVASTLTQLDLSTTAYGGLTAATYTDMSVRQRANGVWSDWSLPVNWGYVARPALAFTSPTSTTGDPTPPHVWTVTPGGHMAWQLLVTDSTGKTLYDSKRTSGAGLSDTPDKGPTKNGATATSTLRVWDRADRIATPGQPTYTTLTLGWTLNLNLATLPASVFSVEQIRRTPNVRLSWMRSSGAPDEWLVTRTDPDGSVSTIARFDYTDNAVGAGWEIEDWTCPPETYAEYAVIPIVSGSGGTPYTATITTNVTGMWLTDQTSGAFLSLAGDEVAAGLAESSATFTTIGGRRTVVRTYGLRGREGTAKGQLWDYDDRTVEDMVADFYTLRAICPKRTVRQVKGRQNIEVAVLGLTEDDNSEWQTSKRDVRDVSWSFYQADYDADDGFGED